MKSRGLQGLSIQRIVTGHFGAHSKWNRAPVATVSIPSRVSFIHYLSNHDVSGLRGVGKGVFLHMSIIKADSFADRIDGSKQLLICFLWNLIRDGTSKAEAVYMRP